MRGAGILTFAVLMVAGPALADDKPPIMVRAEQCLTQNVDRVIAAEPDIQSAANFLVTYACAREIHAASRYEQNVMLAKAYSAMISGMSTMATSMAKDTKDAKGSKGGKDTPKPPNIFGGPITLTVDPETGDIVIPKSEDGTANPFAAMLPQMSAAQTQMMGQEPVPVSLRTLAGDLVLAARARQAAAPRA